MPAFSLRRGMPVAIDTPASIYLLERHPDFGAAARELFAEIESGHVRACASMLVLTELTVPAFRKGEGELAHKAARYIEDYPYLRLMAVDMSVALSAARLRASHGLRTPDAIHAATALCAGAEAFITNDRRLKRLEKAGLLHVLLFGGENA